VEDVATPQAWRKNPELVLDFYNQRRRQALDAKPNQAHIILKDLEKYFEVVVVTQNVDDLHEKAKSKNILHLHGQLFQSRSTKNEDAVFDIQGTELNLGDRAPDGSQLRPHIVWFGEAVPMMEAAIDVVSTADVFLVVGTSLQVYPAASLVDFVPRSSVIYVVDPDLVQIAGGRKLIYIQEPASKGMETVRQHLAKDFNF
jgi:NAD-dependent deacetylase